MKKRKYIYLAAALVIIAAGAYFIFFGGDSNKIEYRTEKVSRGDVTLQVRATGTINPVRTVLVGTQVSGIIEKIYVDFNSEVRLGQPLAQIDSTFLFASVKEAEANLERNRAQLNESARNLNRTKELSKKDLVSQAELDAAQTAFEAATAQLKQSQGSADRAQVNLQYAVIRAPIDGIVISRDVDVGQTVASSFQTPKMFTIAQDLKAMQVEASVDEADIGQVQMGQHVAFSVDAYPQQEFSGTVTQIRLAPVTVQNVVTYTVIISVRNDDMRLRPGMTATATIEVDKKAGVLRIPILATRFQPPAEVLEKIKEKESPPEKIAEVKSGAERDSGSGRKREFRQGGGNGSSTDGPSRRSAEGGRMTGRSDNSGERSTPELRGKKVVKLSRVWIMTAEKELKSLAVKTGLTDSRWVEVLGDQLKEGDEVIIGTTGGNNIAGAGGQTNPFGQQRVMIMGGGGSGGRR